MGKAVLEREKLVRRTEGSAGHFEDGEGNRAGQNEDGAGSK